MSDREAMQPETHHCIPRLSLDAELRQCQRIIQDELFEGGMKLPNGETTTKRLDWWIGRMEFILYIQKHWRTK